MGAIERAKIYELDTQGNQVTPGIDVCFNPKEYSLEKSLSWESSKAHSDAPLPEFKSPSAMSLSVTLQFDTYEERVSVRDKFVRKLEKLTFMKGDAKDKKDVKNHAPPRVMFVWGKMTFRGEVALKMRQVHTSASETMESSTNDMAGKTAGTRTVPVKAGDRLDLIAAKELGDASRWSEIAALNGIEDPANIKDGNGNALSQVTIPNN